MRNQNKKVITDKVEKDIRTGLLSFSKVIQGKKYEAIFATGQKSYADMTAKYWNERFNKHFIVIKIRPRTYGVYKQK
jgi:hypothetical protein